MVFDEIAPWTAESQRRYEWFLRHVETCQTCDLYTEDDDDVVCADLRQFWDEGGIHALDAEHQHRRAGAGG